MCTAREKLSNKVIPKLKNCSAQIFDIHLSLDRKDVMKIFTENFMRAMVNGGIKDINRITKAMEILPKRK